MVRIGLKHIPQRGQEWIHRVTGKQYKIVAIARNAETVEATEEWIVYTDRHNTWTQILARFLSTNQNGDSRFTLVQKKNKKAGFTCKGV